MKQYIKSIIKLTIVVAAMLMSSACEKFVQVSPPDSQITSVTVFSNDQTATAAITGIYSRMIVSNGFASGGAFSVTALAGLSADELMNHNSSAEPTQFFNNAILPANSILYGQLWQEPFGYIYTANAILEGLKASVGISDSSKIKLSGEAKFVRAFCNFYLINLFGDIPAVTTTDYKLNATLSRADAAFIYQQIIQDLQEAVQSLPGDFSASKGERIRPNKWTAMAMLARVYLYTGDWTQAESYSGSVISDAIDFQLNSDPDNVFLANSGEAIWQLQPSNPGMNTNEGNLFILEADPTDYSLTNSLFNAFEPGDIRKTKWVGVFVSGTDSFYYPFKYKIKTGSDLTEYSMVLRLAEQYLIRAEARAMLNNIPGAQDDLNAIRNRAGLSNTMASDQSSLLTAITHERQVELFTEWGHRWLDLKRTGRADSLLTILKAPGWTFTDTLYPIPQSERLLDPNLSQNPGY